MRYVMHDLARDLARKLHAWAGPDERAGRAVNGSTPLREGEEPIVATAAFEDLRALELTFGSTITDAVLSLMRAKIARNLPAAKFGRTGRGLLEFSFIAPSALGGEAMLARLRDVLSERVETNGQAFELAVAMGYTSGDLRDEGAAKRSQLAVELARVHPTRLTRYKAGDREDVAAQLQLLNGLRHAITADELFLELQPKLHTRDMRVSSAEALVRWRHPQEGLVAPDRFITLAEQTGMIGELTRWVIKRAMQHQAELAAAGHEIELHINISGRLLPDLQFAAWALEAVKEAVGVIGFEITETAVIAEPEAAMSNLRAFVAAGIKIAIDDYGSGLSSLAYLKELPASELKIDKMFISGLATSHRDPLLVRSTIELAHALDMEVTAEGVEDAATLALLKLMGCDLIQGYAVSRALSVADFADFMRDVPVHSVSIPRLSLNSYRP
jgi:EAL domain-containing protein (putative c-di-GMP-specific phosphodiesterase class I)